MFGTAFDYFFVGFGIVRFSDDLSIRAARGQVDAPGAGTQTLIDGNLAIDVSKVATVEGGSAISEGITSSRTAAGSLPWAA